MKPKETDEEELIDTLFWAELQGVRAIEIKTIGEWLERHGCKIDPYPSDESLRDALKVLLDHLASLNVFASAPTI
jgi:hypothetical protein